MTSIAQLPHDEVPCGRLPVGLIGLLVLMLITGWILLVMACMLDCSNKLTVLHQAAVGAQLFVFLTLGGLIAESATRRWRHDGGRGPSGALWGFILGSALTMLVSCLK